MRKNMGPLDRGLRLLLAVAVLVLYLAGVLSGPVAIGLGVLAVVFFLTSLVGTCPAYLPFGFSTRRGTASGGS